MFISSFSPDLCDRQIYPAQGLQNQADIMLILALPRPALLLSCRPQHRLENALKSCYMKIALSRTFSAALIAAITALPRWSSGRRGSEQHFEAVQWN
jgi:hypothetical protein